MKKKILAVEAKRFGRNAQSYDFKVGKLGNDTASGHVAKLVDTISGEILAGSKYF